MRADIQHTGSINNQVVSRFGLFSSSLQFYTYDYKFSRLN
jgi:hypothetical protein